MLTAMELLSDGWEEHQGIGELVGVDLGGATTDVYSIAEGSPANMATVMKGIQEPYAKRSVEGDIGMRYSVQGILEAVGDRRLAQIAGVNRQKVAGAGRVSGNSYRITYRTMKKWKRWILHWPAVLWRQRLPVMQVLWNRYTPPAGLPIFKAARICAG